MVDAAFKVGDVVILKSGGPLMTVSTVEAGHLFTVWYAKETQEVKYSKLKPETVRRADNM